MNELTKTETSSPYFSIVIPAYNEEEHIGSCLKSILESNYDSNGYEVIVVDNGSQDRTREIALNTGQVKVLELPEGNVGAVRNYGATMALGEILVFIDADCLLDKDWLNRAEQLIKEKPNCAYGGGIRLPTNATWIEKFWLLEYKGRPNLPKHLIGASTLIPKKLFFSINGFNERVSSGEDTELHNCLTFQGATIIFNNSLTVTHLGNAKTSMQFIKRQIWHAEYYSKNTIQSIKDPIFIAALTFLTLPTFITALLFLGESSTIIIYSILSWLLIPAVLSCKRIFRAKQFVMGLNDICKIYYLDFIYLTGRSLGILKIIVNRKKYKK
ncbi:glycosyltransferase family 2 protein [Marinobacter sp. 1_MG-2023]|uniref:glycosyltransferase n=1 Tax=Marinobacter sp. 1_MG-2023 TaxID=3062627 RepID=UPI0026E2663E|nr:glycosyltransferase [Marinobacter sp. 1_MG-2023]MDO6824573.1 glycosyltransferase [Marinobacter sp. 1_MG-2023]